MPVSTVYTKLTHLKTEEFLSQIENILHHSPVIQELCKRLEDKEEFGNSQTDCRIVCPICQGQLEIDWDIGNNILIPRITDD